MEHGTIYQCVDSVRQHIVRMENDLLERGSTIRELEADKEMIDVRLSELQCHYAEIEQEKEELGATIRDLRDDRQRDGEQIAHLLKRIDTLQDEAKPKEAGVHTTRLYWDCNCEKDYINHSYITKCEICGAHNVDQPDSRLEELGMARLSGINELAERYARSRSK